MGAFDIPDPIGEFPDGQATIRVLATPDTHPDFWDAFGAAYHEKHPNVDFEYEGFPFARIREILPVAMRSGNAHDLFVMGLQMVKQAVDSGWLAPLDDIVPNFEEWKAAWPEGSFVRGVHEFAGKTYSFPGTSRKSDATLLYGNPSILEKVGVDLSETPTWDEFRDAARKITSAGAGEFFGFAIPGVRLQETVRRLCYTTGRMGEGDIDARTGRHIASSDEYREAIELLLAIQSDGSLFPGSLAMTGQEAPPRVLAGNVGMIIDGPWTARNWEKDAPEFGFSVTGLPMAGTPEGSAGMIRPATSGYLTNTGSEHLQVVGDIMHYMGSEAGQIAGAEVWGFQRPSPFKSAREALKDVVSDNGRAILEQGEKLIVPPNPSVRNPDIAVVNEALKSPKQVPGPVIEGIMVGDITDIGPALRKLGDGFDRALDDAIATARKAGAEVSRDDYVFGNFDPTRDYAAADYEAL